MSKFTFFRKLVLRIDFETWNRPVDNEAFRTHRDQGVLLDMEGYNISNVRSQGLQMKSGIKTINLNKVLRRSEDQVLKLEEDGINFVTQSSRGSL